MSGKVKIVKNNTKAILDALSGDRLGRAVMAGGFILETAVKVSMSAASHSGRTYGGHRASAPGETPAVQYGVLVNSINTELVSSSPTSAFAQVGTGVEYAEPLEFGTSKMEARPFMRPGYDNNERQIENTIRQFVKQSIEGATK
jgi:HK97 gp10 family phage protein